MITSRLAISEDLSIKIRPSNFLAETEKALSAVLASVSAIKSGVIMRARVFSSTSVNSIPVTGRPYKRSVTAKDLGEHYLHSVVGR